MNPRTPRRGRLLLLAVVALLVVSAGSATAAALVTGKQIKDGTVTGKDLRDRSVTGTDVGDASLGPADFAGVVEGPPGPRGPQGPRGLPGIRGVEYVTSAALFLPPGKWGAAFATCPVAAMPIGGGFATLGGPGGMTLTESSPFGGPGVGWTVAIRNDGATTRSGYAWAVCARSR